MVYYQRSYPKGHCGIAETPKTQQSFQSIAHERPGRKELHRVDDSHIQAVMLQYASVAQGIEQWFPVPCVGVRIPPDAFLCKYTSDSSQHLETEDKSGQFSRMAFR